MAEKFSKHFQIGYFDTDKQRNLLPHGLLLLFQELAIEHSESIGVSIKWLAEQKRGWAVTNWHVKIQKMPQYGQKVILSTWAHKMRKMQATRNFTITTEDGEELVSAMSLWIFMDLEKRGFTALPEELIQAYLCEDAPPFADEKFLFPKKAEGTLLEGHRFTVKRGDTDTNGHTNNIRYVEWALDDIPDAVFGGRLEEMKVIYRKECYRGSQVKTKAYLQEKDGRREITVYLLDGASAEESVLAQVLLAYGC